MKRAEELAYTEYPYKEGYDRELPYPGTYDENSEKREGFIKGYEASQNDIRPILLRFFADSITHRCDKGLILNIPDYTTLIEKLSDKLGFDLMPILKNGGYKADD